MGAGPVNFDSFSSAATAFAHRVLGAWGSLGVSLGVDNDLMQAGRALVCGCAAAITADARAVRTCCGRGTRREDEREERGERRRS